MPSDLTIVGWPAPDFLLSRGMAKQSVGGGIDSGVARGAKKYQKESYEGSTGLEHNNKERMEN
jgi:hypothetical protein